MKVGAAEEEQPEQGSSLRGSPVEDHRRRCHRRRAGDLLVVEETAHFEGGVEKEVEYTRRNHRRASQ